jgi:hypothetical protein
VQRDCSAFSSQYVSKQTVAPSVNYLRCQRDGFDHVWDEELDLRYVHPENREAVIVDPELSHEKERLVEETRAL